MLRRILYIVRNQAWFIILPFLLLSCAAAPKPEPKVIILTIEKHESLKDSQLEITIYHKRCSDLDRLYLGLGSDCSPGMDIMNAGYGV
jgi:hypothetical protein